MEYTLYELLFFFFIYAFFGWCMEVIYATVGKRKFVNRGLLNGVLCPVYGYTICFLLVFFDPLKEDIPYLFLGCLVMTSVHEFLTGNLLEKLFGKKCWDYSGYPLHIGSYVCLYFSLLWATGSILVIRFIQPLIHSLVDMIPELWGKILLSGLSLLLLLDMATTVAAIRKLQVENKPLQEIAKGLRQVSGSLSSSITKSIHRRMTRAFPGLAETGEDTEKIRQEGVAKRTIFAYGCSFYKLVWLFFLGALLGDITETIFCFLTTGVLMSRSSLVYGSFSIVWGIGVVFLTILLHKYSSRNDRFIFLSGTVLGGAYEYICSMFTELAFGTVFWDYSGIPFNLGGRINLLYCFFWGIAALIWIKGIYPFLSKWIEKIPMKTGKVLSWCYIIFMIANITISGMVLIRYSERNREITPKGDVEKFIDLHYDDARMEQIYPNAIQIPQKK